MFLFLLLLCVHAAILNVEPVFAESRENTRVLLLNSYHQGFEWTDAVVEAVQEEFGSSEGSPASTAAAARDSVTEDEAVPPSSSGTEIVEIYVEYMDAKRFSLTGSARGNEEGGGPPYMHGYLEEKYRGRQPDLIIASDDAALSFLREHREGLFPSVPVVFCGINRESLTRELEYSYISAGEDITGVYERVDVRGTIELARTLQPELQHVVAVSDATETGSLVAERIRAAEADYPGLSFSYISGRTTTTGGLELILASLDPERTAVLYNYWLYDAAGKRYEDEEAVSLVSSASAAPVYSFFDFRLGSGILGGAMVSGGAQGRLAAELGLRILGGTPADAIAPLSRGANTCYIDWRVLKEFSIPSSRIPADAVFLNKPRGFSEFYRKYTVWIWIVGVLLAVETVMVVLLSSINRQRKIAYRRRREAEEMMLRSEKMVSVGGLAAGVAHEINNPLSGILQNIQLISSRIEDDSPKNRSAAQEAGIELEALREYSRRRRLDEMIAYIRSSAQTASTIVKDLLLFSRRDHGSRELVNVPEMIDKVLDLAKTDYNLKKHYDFRSIHISKRYGEEVPAVLGSRGKLEQVMFNLIRNAAHAMYEVEEPGREPHLELLAAPEDTFVRIEVADNGVGMDEETRRRVFEPFFTTKGVGEGTGLGLFVSYSIVTEQHEGEMRVESIEGEGSRFTMLLPAARSTEGG